LFGDTAFAEASLDVPRPAGIDTAFELAEDVYDVRPHVVQPVLDPFELRDVISGTSRTPVAGQAWLGVGDRYQDGMLDMAFRASAPGEITVDQQKALAHESLRDAGAIAGALQVETLRAAERRQETIEGAASASLYAASLGSTALPGSPLIWASATSIAGVLAPEVLPQPLEGARLDVLENEPDFRERFAGAAHLAALEHTAERGLRSAPEGGSWDSLAPDSEGAKRTFRETYDLMSDLERNLGENP
jgi:hypothetical protein